MTAGAAGAIEAAGVAIGVAAAIEAAAVTAGATVAGAAGATRDGARASRWWRPAVPAEPGPDRVTNATASAPIAAGHPAKPGPASAARGRIAKAVASAATASCAAIASHVATVTANRVAIANRVASVAGGPIGARVVAATSGAVRNAGWTTARARARSVVAPTSAGAMRSAQLPRKLPEPPWAGARTTAVRSGRGHPAKPGPARAAVAGAGGAVAAAARAAASAQAPSP